MSDGLRDFTETGGASVPTAKPRLSDYAGRNLLVHGYQTKRGRNANGEQYEAILVTIQVVQNRPPFVATTYSEVVLEQLRACQKADFPFRAALIRDGKKLYFATASAASERPKEQQQHSAEV